MKQLFIGLLALNLCYLLFEQLTAEGVESDASRQRLSDHGLGEASLVTEQAASGVKTVVLPEPVPESVAQISLKTDRADAQSNKAFIDPMGVAGQDLVAAVDDGSKTDDIEGVATARQEAIAQPEARAKRLEAASGESVQPGSSCVIAGPFRARQEGQALVAQLANAGIDATLQPRDTEILPDYMVYVGPEKSTAEARALEAKFKARQMDSHVIAAGDLQNALSLGVFSRGPLARSLHQRLEKEGYKASISELTRNRRGYQVLTRLPPLIRAKLNEADTPMIDCPQTIAQR